MNETTFLDRLRARARGELSRAEQDALELELARDPALRAQAEDFALVWALTRHERLLPAPSTDLALLEARMPRPRLRRVAVAAGFLLVAGAAFLAGRASRGPDRALYLRAIELDPPLATVAMPADPPPSWADFDPRGAQGVRFLSDLEEAEELARDVQRPLLVYGSYPGCPLCATLDARVFSDPRVIELAERTVPVRVNLADLSPDEQRSFTMRGYPFLEMWRGDGRTTHSLARNPDPTIFVESLHDGLAKSEATGEQPPWAELHEASLRFEAARTAEREGRMAEAEREFRSLARDPRVPPSIATSAGSGLERLARDARERLLAARDVAERDPRQARALLEEALDCFRDTRFEADLAAALERLMRDGRFPVLAESDHSTGDA